jgi:hypothetical protein
VVRLQQGPFRGFFIMRTSHIHCKINNLLIWRMR